MTTTGKNESSHNLLLLSKNGLNGSTVLVKIMEHQIVEAKEHVQLAAKDITLQHVANLTQVFLRCLQQIKEM